MNKSSYFIDQDYYDNLELAQLRPVHNHPSVDENSQSDDSQERIYKI